MALAYIVNPSSRKRRRRKHRASARRKHSRRRRHAVQSFKSNPARRRRRRRSSFSSLRRIRRNPIAISRGGIVTQMLIPAGIGAAGAIATKIAYGYLPDSVKNMVPAPIVPLARAGVAIGLGMAASKVINRQVGHAVAIGGLVAIGVDVLTDILSKSAPSLAMKLSDASDYPALEFYNQGMGEALPLQADASMGSLIRTGDAFDGVGDDAEFESDY